MVAGAVGSQSRRTRLTRLTLPDGRGRAPDAPAASSSSVSSPPPQSLTSSPDRGSSKVGYIRPLPPPTVLLARGCDATAPVSVAALPDPNGRVPSSATAGGVKSSAASPSMTAAAAACDIASRAAAVVGWPGASPAALVPASRAESSLSGAGWAAPVPSPPPPSPLTSFSASPVLSSPFPRRPRATDPSARAAGGSGVRDDRASVRMEATVASMQDPLSAYR